MSRFDEEPVLSGEIYCSPWCGGGCTKQAHDDAQRRAREMAERMGGKWEPRVWENLGWHWEIRAGKSRILPCGDRFIAWIEPESAGQTVQFIEEAATPEDALGFAVQRARGMILEIERALEAVR